jgi:hypothetical protein
LATSTVQSSSESSNGKILARSSANEDVRAGGEIVERDFREVAIVGNLRVVVSEDGRRKLVDFSEADRPPTEWVPSN